MRDDQPHVVVFRIVRQSRILQRLVHAVGDGDEIGILDQTLVTHNMLTGQPGGELGDIVAQRSHRIVLPDLATEARLVLAYGAAPGDQPVPQRLGPPSVTGEHADAGDGDATPGHDEIPPSTT